MGLSAAPAVPRPRRVRSRSRRPGLAPLALLPVALALLAAVCGGLLRAGVPLHDGVVLGRAALFHAALMIGAFFGTVIGVERAVALRGPFGWPGPAASAAAGFALLAGAAALGGALLLAASLAFVGVNGLVVRRQSAPHTRLLLAAAACWALGNLAFVAGATPDASAAWWFAFLVMTVAAERLEMARLMRHDARASRRLAAALAALVAGAALALAAPAAGGALYGAALLALAAWLWRYDIARRTIHAEGLPRYMAACLLSGYAWLAVAGVAWAATALGWPARDAALHALGLGFVVAMMMGHAPVILPAVARIKVQFGRAFYAPLALLHASLALRLVAGAADPAWRALGAALNAAALLLFIATIAGGAVVWRRREHAALTARNPTP